MKNLCVICDGEADYARAFMEYENRKKTFPMEIAACTSTKSAAELSLRRKVDLLLVAQNAADETLKEVKAEKTVILSEWNGSDGFDELAHVSKLQSCDALLRSVMSSYEAEMALLSPPLEKLKEKKLIGVFSPAGGCGKTAFAVTLGQVLALQEPTIYLNLECFSGIDEIFSLSGERNLSDLLYFSKEKMRFAGVLSACVLTRQGLDMVPGVSSPEDIYSTDPYEWLSVIGNIMENAGYVNIVLEFGRETRGADCIINQCGRVYMPIRGDPFSEAKISRFMKELKKGPYPDAAEKICPVTVPAFDTEGVPASDALLWGGLGDYIKTVLNT